MSVQWFVGGARATYEEALEACKRGATEVHGTVPARNGRPRVYAVSNETGEKTLIEVLGRGSIYEISGDPTLQMAVSAAILAGIDWERTEAAKVKQEGERDMSEEARCYLLAERTSLERMLASLPESSVIDRMSLEARKEKVEEELATMND